MYTFCKKTHPATGVELSLYCNFYRKSEESLVVAGANIIRVFRFVPELPARVSRKEDFGPPKVKLECMGTYTLHDNVATMAVISLSNARDSLLLGFKDAKLSIVEYDPHTHGLRTISLHYFEKDDIKGGWNYSPFLPLVRVDPEGRCAAMLIYGKKIVILPFRRDLTKEELEFPSPLARGPVMQSYIIDPPKEFDAFKIDNVVDMQFLHGYYDPTLILLHEPIKTFPGRVAVRQDTCGLAAISLNLRQRLHPVIWSIAGLPHNCCQLLAVPRPIGGVLVFAANSLIYLTQSVPPYGVSLNSIGNIHTKFPLGVQEGVVISLDNACAQFLTEDRIVISLKGGELYVLTLVTDSMKSVRSFHFDKAASSVLTSCMTICEEQYLFLGSRLGNSLLLRITEKEVDQPLKARGSIAVDHEPPSKRRKVDSLGGWIATDVEAIEDVDVLEVYGPEAASVVQLTSYAFEVMDSLLNIGPCGDITVGELSFLSEEYENMNDPCVEIVTTSGHAKNGALSVLQRSVKPQVLITTNLPGIKNVWTVVGKINERKRKEGLLQDHSFLILTKEDSTLILSTDEVISELEESGFNTTAQTIFAGNMGHNRYIVQVTRGGVRLLEGSEVIQRMPIDVGSPVVAASCADPYLVILTDDGSMILCTMVVAKGKAPMLNITRLNNAKKSVVQTVCVYCDFSGLFTTLLPFDGTAKVKTVKTDAEIKKELDDEDELLYGASNSSMLDPFKLFYQGGEEKTKKVKWWRRWLRESKPSYWLVTTTDTGDLDLYSLPEFALTFVVKNFWLGHKILKDSIQVSISEHLEQKIPPEEIPTVHEVLLVGMGNKNLRPVLFARVGDDLLMYEAFQYSEGLDATQLKLRFCLIEHGLILRDRKNSRYSNDSLKEKEVDRINHFVVFSNVGAYSGVFIAGSYPHWVILTVHGEFRFHPMSIDGSVKCFAPFRNVKCQNGFLYLNRKDALRICLLPNILVYDAPWPVRKVPLRCSPHFVVFHCETKTYCVVTSTSSPTLNIWKFNGDDKEEISEDRDDRFIQVQSPLFTVQLYSPVNFQKIPNTDFDFVKWEHVTCCKNVYMAYEGDRSGLRGYIGIGTNFCYGEDIVCRGRILLFDVIEVVPEPGQPLTKNRLKLLYSGEQKGPVTAISHVCGFLVTAIGQKIYIWELKNNNLIGIAFMDTQIYIHQLFTIKSLLLSGDVCKSLSLLRFQAEEKTLSLVSRDIKPMQVYAVQFLVDNTTLAFLASDVDKNLVVFTYNPEARESFGGVRLVRKGDINIGQHVNTFFRIKCRSVDVSGEKQLVAAADKKQVVMMATLDGALGYVLPINERTYRRFSMIYNLLVQHLPHVAGLNPKACRAFRSRQKLNVNASRGVIDGDILWSFIHLPMHEKADIAKKIGSRVDDIMDDLLLLDRLTCHF